MNNTTKETKALRFNEGKLRFDLLHPIAQAGITKVLTKGSIKYAPRNWEKGMSWMSVAASLKRHLLAFDSGEDYDSESGELHVDHIQCNAHFLSAYYKIAPQHDDRPHHSISTLKIALDIDEVLAGFIPAWCELWAIPTPRAWSFEYGTSEKFTEMRSLGTLNNFYLNSIKPICSPDEIPFEPHCYITSRPVNKEISQQWLQKHGFPAKPVFNVPYGESKIKAFKESGADIMVDDKYETYKEFMNANLCCYLFDAPHNQRYNVGYRRLKALRELTEIF